MILAFVQIPIAKSRPEHAEAVRGFLDSTIHFHQAPGLRRKYFLSNDDGLAGVYEFATRADAEAWFNADWPAWMEGRFGVRPTLSLFDNPVVLDNEADEVRVMGKPVTPPWSGNT